MSWIKLCESEKSWQIYHSEDLSPTHFASRKTNKTTRVLPRRKKNMRLKLLKNQRILRVGSTFELKLSNYFNLR